MSEKDQKSDLDRTADQFNQWLFDHYPGAGDRLVKDLRRAWHGGASYVALNRVQKQLSHMTCSRCGGQLMCHSCRADERQPWQPE